MIEFKQIGITHTQFKEPANVPIQPIAGLDIGGSVEIYPEYSDGLKDLNGFSHLYLIYHFHLIKDGKLLVKPFLDDTLRGVFATRAPSRPNPIGLSIVRLEKISGNILFIKDLDIVDGTPLLDIKPFVPKFDNRNLCKIGWLENNLNKLSSARDDCRFIK